MSRWLSPTRICLVVLIDVYHHQEARSSDTVAILSFIASHILTPSSKHHRSGEGSIEPRVATLPSFEALLKPLTSNFPGRSLYDVFLRYLWSLSTLEAIETLIAKSRLPTDPPSPDLLPIQPTSPIGQYLRRCKLEYARLPFGDTQQIYEDCIIFREPSFAIWAARNPEDAAALPKIYTGGMGAISPILVERQARRMADGHDVLPSHDVLDRTISFQLEQIQSTGCRLSPDMEQQLKAMVNRAAIAPADVHFLKFFDAWRAGAYSEAIDCLHRYFDYSMEGYASQQSIKTYHQYALLHLAVLHADFGCYEEAIAAMNECIATARENQDARCLNFALSWLVHLRKAHPEYSVQEKTTQKSVFAGSESDILLFLQQKALESRDWTQLSNALLSQAETALHNAGAIPKAIELSMQARHIHLKHSIESLQPAQNRLSGSIFALMGIHCLADLTNTTHAAIYHTFASEPENLNVECLQAYELATQGRHKEALHRIKACSPTERRSLKMYNLHLGFAYMIKLRRALYRNELTTAGRLLKRVRPLRGTAEPDVAFETHLLEIDYLRKSGSTDAALDHVDALFASLKATTSAPHIHRLRLQVVKADLWAHAGRSAKGFTVALRAANAAAARLLLPVLWTAVAALATVLDDLREHAAARAMLDAVIPKALEGGDVALVGRLYALLADAGVGVALGEHAKGSKERDGLLNGAAVYLERAKEAYDRLEDVDGILACLEKKAMLFRYRGEEDLAEEMDGMYEAEAERARKRENVAAGIEDE